MGSIISRINESYDSYTEICKALEIEPKPLHTSSESFLDHFAKLLSACACSDEYEFFSNQKKDKSGAWIKKCKEEICLT